jgi:hypothetical protein
VAPTPSPDPTGTTAARPRPRPRRRARRPEAQSTALVARPCHPVSDASRDEPFVTLVSECTLAADTKRILVYQRLEHPGGCRVGAESVILESPFAGNMRRGIDNATRRGQRRRPAQRSRAADTVDKVGAGSGRSGGRRRRQTAERARRAGPSAAMDSQIASMRSNTAHASWFVAAAMRITRSCSRASSRLPFHTLSASATS